MDCGDCGDGPRQWEEAAQRLRWEGRTEQARRWGQQRTQSEINQLICKINSILCGQCMSHVTGPLYKNAGATFDHSAACCASWDTTFMTLFIHSLFIFARGQCSVALWALQCCVFCLYESLYFTVYYILLCSRCAFTRWFCSILSNG